MLEFPYIFYEYHPKQTQFTKKTTFQLFTGCNCDPQGTEEEVCDKVNGICVCQEGFGGSPRCDKCESGWYEYPDCKPCNCSDVGAGEHNVAQNNDVYDDKGLFDLLIIMFTQYATL